ncbi:MAG: RNA repair domain-containing protein [Candidatus Thermoplasmatota archaeon]
MRSAKDVLDMLRWHPNYDIAKAVIWYEDRHAPTRERCIAASEIKEFGPSFFGVESASIPYHRVFRIEHDGRVVFERPKRSE